MLTINVIFLLGIGLLLVPALAVFATMTPDNTAAAFVAGELAKNRKPNRLINEKSPYLLQHAFNPVDWYPWSEEAFERARREDKPIFLSIGYSTCHWCHVMAHESFENEALAAILNEHFICIKVDREERPDLDQIYMAATQALTGGGGWPMSVFLTPDRKPFYAGTYFPPESKHGLPGFGDLLLSIHRAWIADRDNISKAADNITSHLQQISQSSSGALEKEILTKGYKQIAAMYDEKDGGFGKAPKFPRPVVFNFLLRYHDSYGEKNALDMTTATLRRMAAGGMYDHLGGGFHRYSVDGQWRVPHFEKMLYDQSQLAISYLEVFQITRDRLYSRIAGETLDYVLRDMTAPEGGFFSAEDADSPVPDNPAKHSEGAFYLWSEKEITSILGAERAAVFNYRYGVQAGGNAQDDPHGEFTGKNILYIARNLDSTARHFEKSIEDMEATLRECRRRLFDVRQKRPRSHLDDKIITAWNGLMISALAKGYQVLEERRYLTGAEKAASFVLSALFDAKTKNLHRRYRDGQAGLPGQLDDYAFFIQGLLDLYETSFDIRWLRQAVELTKIQITRFEDSNRGGFFDSASDDDSLLLRMKSDYDGAEPAGNSIAVLNLLRLAQFTGNQEWKEKADKAMEAFGGKLSEHPPIMPQMLAALEFSLQKPLQVVLAGDPDREDYRQLLREVHGRFLPSMILLAADQDKGQEYLAQLLPFMKEMTPIDHKATAYVCENYTCKMPATEQAALAKILNDRRP